jgi:hypothetical protein
MALAPAGAGVQTGDVGRLAPRRAGLLGVLLVALVVALQVAGSRPTPVDGPYIIAVAAAWWALLLRALWCLAVRLRGR